MNNLSIEIWDVLRDPEELTRLAEKVSNEDFDRVFYFCLNDFLYWDMPQQYQQLLSAVSSKEKKLEVLVGLSSFVIKEPSHPNVDRTFWDIYWLIKTYLRLRPQEQLLEYKYHFVSMNHRAKVHRCMLMDLLAKYDLLSNNAVSWHERSAYTWRYFDGRLLTLTDDFANNFEQYRLPVEYSQSFAQLVAETSLDVIEISEKTATPLILGKPFLVLGADSNSQLLTKLGFEQYTEIFDYSFDTVSKHNHFSRCDKLVSNFTELEKTPLDQLPKLYDKVKDKILHNQNRVKELVFDFNNYPDPVREVLDIYDTTGQVLNQELIDIYRKLLLLKLKS
jgi:hypothetical protein